ncbi:hypothetical protein [Chryseobacterium sp.]|uniref:hypothetical protein n=1 Tax=Chryseobacterium sp. TaxID=1871047 RepID=UPI0012A995E0|nr:hypothetical protein [Chryseobacterium sp.]QFG53188.1 hypothetical protein F7R58_06390 [Chryseobacterium sp.]
MNYKVLWIDDKFDDANLKHFKTLAKMEDIELIEERFHFDGMETLKRDHNYEIQAVILDATGYNKTTEEIGESNIGLKNSLKELLELRKKRVIPWFVYTGAPRNIDNFEFREELKLYQQDIAFGSSPTTYYTKVNDDDLLLQDIKFEINKLINTQTEFRHKAVFDACRRINLPQADSQTFLNILRSVETNDFKVESSIYFNTMRILYEYVLRDAAKNGLLHEKCIDNRGKINLTDSRRFLAGQPAKNCKVICKKAHLPKILADNLNNFLQTTGAASHTSDVDQTVNYDYQSYRQSVNTPYLLNTLVFILCDFLIWYDTYLKQNADIELNKLLWQDLPSEEWIEGFVSAVKDNGWGTFVSKSRNITVGIHFNEMNKKNLKKDDPVKVILKEENNKHIKELEKLNP